MKKILQNTAFQLIGGIASKIIGMSFVLVASRSLGTEGYGKYSFIFTFTSFFTMMASFGVPTIATRELAKRPDDRGRILGDIIILKFALGFVSVLLCLAFGKILGYGADLRTGINIICIGLLFSFLDSYRALFQATLLMQYNMYSSVLHDVLLLLSALYLAYIKAGFISFVWAGMICTLISSLVLTGQGYRMVKPKFGFNGKRLILYLKESIPLGLASFVVYLYYNADTIMLSKLSTMVAVGYYSVAYKFVFLGQMIPQALVTSLFPGFSHDVVHHKEKAEGNLKKAYGVFTYLAFGIAILGILYHKEVIMLMFGENYLPASLPLLVFSISFIFMLPNILFSKYFVALGEQRYIFYVHLASAALNVLLNFYAVPRFGVAGAAVTTLLSDIVVFCAFFYKMNMVLEFIEMNILNFIYLIFVSAIMIAAGILVHINWIIEAVVIGAVYLWYVFKKEKYIADLVARTFKLAVQRQR